MAVTDELAVDAAAPTPLTTPRDGVPDVVDDAAALAEAVRRLAAGTGAVAADGERASGYRYGQRAYLVQLRREGAGTVLVDPIACPDLSGIDDVLRDEEWVFHAASQDLPSLREVGLRPRRLFDTELAARLAGYDRVGLATMVERTLGLLLAKEHSAADWSVRPLPEPWLRYAALDVEVLLDLRQAVAAELDRQGKSDWAAQEFQAVLDAPPPPPRVDPWRRTSGIHRIRNRRQLAVVRALWQARDGIARERDVAPGRVLPDLAVVGAASSNPDGPDALRALPGWNGRSTRRLVPQLWPVVAAARSLPDDELPRPPEPTDAPPPVARWAERDPVAHARLSRMRAALAELSEQRSVPVENLLTPDLVRRLAWSPPDDGDIDAFLARGGARPWQRQLTAELLREAIQPDPSTS